MIKPQIPDNEDKRLELIKKLQILETPIEERFERITRIVTKALNVPIAAFSIVENNRQWFKSIQGLDITETPRDMAFCAHAIHNDYTLVVQDATKDPRFQDNPLVLEEPNIRFYAGCPLSLGDNIHIGTLCAIDNNPKEITENEMSLLEDLGKLVESELRSIALSSTHTDLLNELKESSRSDLIDTTSRLWKKEAALKLVELEWSSAIHNAWPLTFVMLSIENINEYFEEAGQDLVDMAIRHFSFCAMSVLNDEATLCRWSLDEFILVLPNMEQSEVFYTIDKITRSLNGKKLQTPIGSIDVVSSVGALTVNPITSSENIDEVIALVEGALNEARSSKNDKCVIRHQVDRSA